jgi:hypothetical protein
MAMPQLDALHRPQRGWTIKSSVNLSAIVAAQKAFACAGLKAAVRAQ